MAFGTVVVPESLQWWGWGREVTAPGTVAAPTISMPLMKGEPDPKITMLVDKSIYGDMAEDHGDIQGVEIGEFPLSGDVYLDSIGHPVFNLMGDYQSTGTSPTSATTVAAATAAGATTVTVGAIGTIVIGSVLQFGNAAIGTAPTETLVVQNVVGSAVTFATPTRFAHSSSAAIAIVSAPFTHVFSLLNSGFGQPATHTITYFNELSGSNLARQYAYWCCSGIDFKLNPEQLFQHDTKGTCLVGIDAASPVTNVQSGLPAVADWNFKVGIGGPASGGTLVSNIVDCTVSYARGLKPQFTLQGAQAPWIIPRLMLGVTGKFTFMAQDETPLTSFLANTQPQVQIAMTQGAGASQVGMTFDFQNVAYEAVPIAANDVLTWDVSWRAIANTTNAGFSGARSPGKITLINAIPTY